MWRLKMQDWNLVDQIAGLENAGLEIVGQNVINICICELQWVFRLILSVHGG